MRGTVPALSISGAAGGCPYIERKEKKMKKETIMKIICPAALLCLGAKAGFMAGKMNTGKKKRTEQDRDFTLINACLSESHTEIYEEVKTAFDAARKGPVELYLSDDVEDYMILKFGYRKNHMDGASGVIVMSIIVLCEGIPLVISEQALSFTEAEIKTATSFVMSYIEGKGSGTGVKTL